MDADAKRELYRQVTRQVEALLDGQTDPVATMASAASVLHEALPYASWTGFYRVVGPELLRIGPYQGPPGCLEIRFGEGVCGAAAREDATQVVDDVHAFPGHIACDPRARSEIVVPVHDDDGRLAAVLDVDSHQPGAFDEADRDGIESLAAVLARHLSG